MNYTLSEDKLRSSVLRLKEKVNSKDIKKFLDLKVSFASFARVDGILMIYFFNFKEFKSQDIDELLELLKDLSIHNVSYAFHIRKCFSYLLMPIASLILDEESKNVQKFQQKCIALSIFSENNQQVLR